MKYSLRNHIFLIKRDFISTLKEHKWGVISGIFLLIGGIVLGIYIGSDVGEKETPFGMFASLFGLEYSPFGYLVPDFLRFLLFAALCFLAFLLPAPMLYPAVAILFFGKYFGEAAYVCFLSDPVIPAILNILLIYIPLLIIGGAMLISVTIKARASRVESGADPCRKSIKRELFYVLTLLLAYFVILFLLDVVICGVIYLVVIAL